MNEASVSFFVTSPTAVVGGTKRSSDAAGFPRPGAERGRGGKRSRGGDETTPDGARVDDEGAGRRVAVIPKPRVGVLGCLTNAKANTAEAVRKTIPAPKAIPTPKAIAVNTVLAPAVEESER